MKIRPPKTPSMTRYHKSANMSNQTRTFKCNILPPSHRRILDIRTCNTALMPNVCKRPCVHPVTHMLKDRIVTTGLRLTKRWPARVNTR